MGVVSHEMEFSSPVPPAKMFKALVLDSDKLMPEILPQAIKSVEILEGDGGPGTIKQINFGEGSEYKFVKHRIDAIDKENLTHAYTTVIEGDALMKSRVEKISNKFKFEASPDGGSICKSSSKFYTIDDVEIKEEEINAGKQMALGMFKAVEAHLLANPEA